MDKALQTKISKWKSFQPDTEELTRREVCDLAVSTATRAFTPLLTELAHDLKAERAANLRLRKELAQANEEINNIKQVTTKPSFPKSQQLTKMLNELDDLQAETKRLELAEFSEWRRETLNAIATRNAKAAKAAAYHKAVNHGSYSEAVTAIRTKQQEVQQAGIEIEYGAGCTVKGLFDSEDGTLFCFDLIPADTVYLHGAPFQILERSLSSIGAGHTYRIKLIH